MDTRIKELEAEIATLETQPCGFAVCSHRPSRALKARLKALRTELRGLQMHDYARAFAHVEAGYPTDPVPDEAPHHPDDRLYYDTLKDWNVLPAMTHLAPAPVARVQRPLATHLFAALVTKLESNHGIIAAAENVLEAQKALQRHVGDNQALHARLAAALSEKVLYLHSQSWHDLFDAITPLVQSAWQEKDYFRILHILQLFLAKPTPGPHEDRVYKAALRRMLMDVQQAELENYLGGRAKRQRA